MKRIWVPVVILSVCAFAVLLIGVLGIITAFSEWRVEFTVLPDGEITVECGDDFSVPDVKAVFCGNVILKNGINAEVTQSGSVDPDKVGTYRIEWHAEKFIFSADAKTTVNVVDTTPPEITLTPETRKFILPGTVYEDPGFTARDTVDGDLSENVEVKRNDDGATLKLTYSVSDSSGNTASLDRVIKYDDPEPPVISLSGESRIELIAGHDPFDDPGYSAADNVDGDVTDRVTVDGKVDHKKPGEYAILYSVEDSWGNRAEAERVVVCVDPEPPVITLKGESEITLYAGQGDYTEPGITATDNVDGDVTGEVTVEGEVDASTPGVYVLRYSVRDSMNNKAQAERRVTVVEQSVPRRVTVQKDYPDNGPLPDKVIFLTFDDGPSNYTEQLLDVLKKHNVKATFFVTGKGRRDLIAREAAEGHSVGVHTFTHVYRTVYSSEDAFWSDVWAVNEIIKEQTGSYSSLLRFPGGSSNTVSRFNPGIMTRLASEVTAAGFTYFDWNVSSGDAGETTVTSQVYRNVISGVSGKNVSIVLQHDTKGFSVAAVEDIIEWGLENGYAFLPLTPTSPTVHHNIAN